MTFTERQKWAIVSAHEPSVEVAFVECIKCRTQESVDSTDTDEHLEKYFESKGWSVLPTLCPKCKGGQK